MEKRERKLKPWVMASRLILEHQLPVKEAEEKTQSLAVTGMKIKFYNGHFGVRRRRGKVIA